MNIITLGLIGFLSGSYFNKLSLFLVSVLGGYAVIENVDNGIENTISLVKTELMYVLTGWIMGSIWNNISLMWILLGIVMGVFGGLLPIETKTQIVSGVSNTTSTVYQNPTTLFSNHIGSYTSSIYQSLQSFYNNITNIFGYFRNRP